MPLFVAIASETPSLDVSQVSSVIELTKSVMGLFGEFPLNIILLASLAGVGLALFSRAKRSAG